jgi:hypothetical protein
MYFLVLRSVLELRSLIAMLPYSVWAVPIPTSSVCRALKPRGGRAITGRHNAWTGF